MFSVEEFPVGNVVVGMPGGSSGSRNGSLRRAFVGKAGTSWFRGLIGVCRKNLHPVVDYVVVTRRT